MKERGCDWSGTLDQLDFHLDPHLDNCQYVDTKCPLNCLQTIPKNKVDQHVAQECTKRPHVCQHCGFKATYEEVVDTHLPECKYVPLQCPNMCGVSCEREVMEDHMKICRLEEVECESRKCQDHFTTSDWDNHGGQNLMNQTTALVAQIKMSVLEQDKNYKEIESKLEMQLEEKEKKIRGQEEKILALSKKIKERDEEIAELKCSQNQFTITNISKQSDQRISNLLNTVILTRRFEMEKFSSQRAKEWKSPAMYTHAWGYKFCIGVDASGRAIGRWNSVRLSLWSITGEYDSQLEWPVKATFTVEVIDKLERGEEIGFSDTCSWNKPTAPHEFVKQWYSLGNKLSYKLDKLLFNDTLYFYVSDIKIITH